MASTTPAGGPPAYRVAVVDGAPGLRLPITAALADRYILVQGPNWEAMWSLLHEQPPDAVVLTDRVPDRPGLKVLRQMRDDTSLGTVPVLYVSADRRHAGAATTAGAAACLVEPVGTLALRTAVERVLADTCAR